MQVEGDGRVVVGHDGEKDLEEPGVRVMLPADGADLGERSLV